MYHIVTTDLLQYRNSSSISSTSLDGSEMPKKYKRNSFNAISQALFIVETPQSYLALLQGVKLVMYWTYTNHIILDNLISVLKC